MMFPTALSVVLGSQILSAYGQTWCGKNYMQGSPIVPPGGQFAFPPSSLSNQPLLSFQCAPIFKPYLAGEDIAGFVVDAALTSTGIYGAVPFTSHGGNEDLKLTISTDTHVLLTSSIPVNTTGHELTFSLPFSGLQPRSTPFNVTCSAQSDSQTFSTSTQLHYLPQNPNVGGNVVKMDQRTGGLLVQTRSGASGDGKDENTSGGNVAGAPDGWETIFPLGFYTSYDGYLTTNLSILDDVKSRGFTIVHPVPVFTNLSALPLILQRMQELDLYLMYDMRYTYQNDTSVTEQVDMIKTFPNLLTWYTGDEPDGTFDPLNATSLAYNHISTVEGGAYHPVSLVLNCYDFYFTDYIQGTDIIMQDTYPISINATFSIEWGTACTVDYGCCGCDDCVGDFGDITARMDMFKQRLGVLGQGFTRGKVVWSVPQAFGASQYWARVPTGQEFLVECILSINHGALGIVPWIDPNTDSIRAAATTLGQSLPLIKPFLFDPTARSTYRHIASNGIDVGLWTLTENSPGAKPQTLLLATNTNYFSGSLSVSSGDVGVGRLGSGQIREVFSTGGSVQAGNDEHVNINLLSTGTVAYILG